MYHGLHKAIQNLRKKGRMRGDLFICTRCGHERTSGTFDNRIDCPCCGGSRTMIRQ